MTKLLREDRKLRLLHDARNALYHYDPEYLSPRFEAVINEPGVLAWAHEVHFTTMTALQDRMMTATDSR